MAVHELMPNYHGSTFVGFIDISGFKHMMNNQRAKAESVLDHFYRTIYQCVFEANQIETSPIKLNAIAVSDCAVLFLSRERGEEGNEICKQTGLIFLLKYLQKMNRSFIKHYDPFMTTSSIAYGEFHYENRREIAYLQKNCLRGKAYIDAFLDNESQEPKINPGEVRILRNNLDINITDDQLLSVLKPKGKHFYFYWMLDKKTKIRQYQIQYKQTTEDMYNELIKLIQSNCLEGEQARTELKKIQSGNGGYT
jgi:hypothetical protein